MVPLVAFVRYLVTATLLVCNPGAIRCEAAHSETEGGGKQRVLLEAGGGVLGFEEGIIISGR